MGETRRRSVGERGEWGAGAEALRCVRSVDRRAEQEPRDIVLVQQAHQRAGVPRWNLRYEAAWVLI